MANESIYIEDDMFYLFSEYSVNILSKFSLLIIP